MQLLRGSVRYVGLKSFRTTVHRLMTQMRGSAASWFTGVEGLAGRHQVGIPKGCLDIS